MTQLAQENGPKNTGVLIFACSGGSNVGQIADQAARQLSQMGCGAMQCLAALAAGKVTSIQQGRSGQLVVIIDGCDLDCAAKLMAGAQNIVHIRVTDLDITKVAGREVMREEVVKVVRAIKEEIDRKKS